MRRRRGWGFEGLGLEGAKPYWAFLSLSKPWVLLRGRAGTAGAGD